MWISEMCFEQRPKKILQKWGKLRQPGTLNYYFITKCPTFRPPPTCLHCLFLVRPSHPWNVQNLTSTSTTTTTKNRTFCDLIVLQPVVTSSYKYHEKIFPERFPSSLKYKWILIIWDGLRISPLILTKCKNID